MKIKEYNFPSATGVCEIHGSIFLPDDNEVKTVLAVHHGMAEHKKRYHDFFQYLTSNGIAVFMHDMANHGKSNQNSELTGYFGNKNGYKSLVKDFKTTFDMAKNAYPDKKLIVMGHSMGSFIVRCFTAWYNDSPFDAAIYMGTGSANPIAAIGDKVTAMVAKLSGYTSKSKLLDKMTFGAYNDKFEKRTPFDWLSRDTEQVDKYVSDDECGFLFSAQGMNDLVKLNMSANTDEWFESVPKDKPILLISGDMDPVGDYGRGIMDIYDKLIATNHSKAQIKLYSLARHEILNEINKDEVYEDLLSYIESV